MTVLKGGVLYRDIVEPNLPGIVWIHLAIRTIAGWSSEAVRLADLLLLAGTLTCLSCIIRLASEGNKKDVSIAAFVLCCCFFYLTRNEWCHCQRDIWMMLPVSAALLFRFRRSGNDRRAVFVEGVAWGIAFWIKPHVAIPACLAILVDSVRLNSWRQRCEQLAFLITGGLAAALPGIVWLIATGAWEHFWEMMLEWNPEYLAAGANRRSWERLGLMFVRLYPWWLVHVVAVPVAIAQIVKMRRQNLVAERRIRISVVMSVFYLGWLLQTFVIQHAMDYIHVPEIVLAMCVLAVYPWRLELVVRRCAVLALLMLGLLSAPQFHNDRIQTWTECLTTGSTPAVRSALAQGNYPDWQQIDRVREFLADNNVVDGDVVCMNVHSIHLHKELGVLPATRYWSVNCLLTMFPNRFEQIMAAVYASDSRYVVVESRESEQKNQVIPKDFPGTRPVLFEAGTYRVYAAKQKTEIEPETLSSNDQSGSSDT